MSNKDYNSVVTREQQEALAAFEQRLGAAIEEATGYSGDDPAVLKRIMREKNIQIHKVINREESGYHIMMGSLHLKFIPAAIVDGVVI